MKTILWTQTETPTTPASILVDGILIEGGELRQENYNMIAELCEEVILTPKGREEFCKKHRLYSSQVNYARPIKGGIYIQGTFLDLDKANRRMPYMFYAAYTGDFNEARKTLIQQASSLNRTCDIKELDALETFDKQSKNQKKNILMVVAGIIALTVALTYLCIYNK